MLSGFNKKTVLLSILVVFIVSNLIYATTDVFNLMLVFRILPALAHAVFFAVALVVAANSVPKEKAAGAAAKVFAGVAIGLVLGVPLSSLIAEHFSLSAAFYFGAAACVLAFLGVLFLMPSMPTLHKVSFASQLSVLRNGKLWLTISTVTLIFAAMFSSFSYVADYLSRVTHLNNNYISAMLILFGVCGFAGNFVFSSFLQKNVVKTTLVYPLLFTLLLLLVWFFGFSPLVMCLLTVFWGAFHSSGLVVSQTWLMREASEAPEFANSLYMSFSNLGITLGSLTGGWFIARLGTHSVVLSSVIFTLLAFVSILIKHRSDIKAVSVQEEMA
jgi:predicted MFS family arabinose efflux permease